MFTRFPRVTRLPAILSLVLLAFLVEARPLVAQPAQTSNADSACSYQRCALSIAPRWNGLALVRGVAGVPVANLAFFWTGSLDQALAGNDSAMRYGARAVRVRRVAAVLTDGGGLLLGYAIARRLSVGSFTRDAQVAAAVGAAGLGVSVPLHFAADGHLSRAVWWHNLRFAR